jgi:predicted dehydrogenase
LTDPVPLGWGVVGAGEIAETFVRDVPNAANSAIVAIGSRTQERASQFGAAFDIPHRHAGYQQLVDDPAVDAVYVCVPHPWHAGVAALALRAGKAVLCEKPFTLNAAEARDLVALARSEGTFLMEAMWTRWLPHMRTVRDLVADGAIGEVVAVHADHSGVFPFDPANRMYDPALGGGALLDLGVYAVSFASDLLGRPARVSAAGTSTSTTVDADTSMLLEHRSGAHAVLTCSLRSEGSNRAVVVGTAGRIEIAAAWYGPSLVTLIPIDGPPTTFEHAITGHGFHYEIDEVERCVRSGRQESDTLPLDESVAVMETLDEVRRQIGLRYPSENDAGAASEA